MIRHLEWEEETTILGISAGIDAYSPENRCNYHRRFHNSMV